LDTKQTNRQTTQEDKKGKEEMKWFKIDFNDVFLNGLTTSEVGCVVKYKCMCQQLGVDELDNARMKSIFTSRELKFVQNYFKVCSKNDEVCSDFAEVCSKNAKVCSKKESKNNEVANIYNIYNNKDKTEEREETENNISDGHQIDLEEAIAEKKKSKHDYSDEFNTWWEKYPNKKSKQDAQKAFVRVLEKKQATFDELMQGLEAYSNDCKAKNTEIHYIKHPSTWLNQGCWADEYGVKEVQEDYVPRVDAEKVKQMASIAELTMKRMMENAQRKYGA
jgi:hypothetical protein